MVDPLDRINDFSYLPDSMQELAESLGLQLVLKLIDQFGGLEIRIPNQLKADMQLMKLGETDAQALIDHCAGGVISVPMRKFNRRETGRLVARLRQAGGKSRDIARHLQISQRHVRRIYNRKDQGDERQDDLFK